MNELLTVRGQLTYVKSCSLSLVREGEAVVALELVGSEGSGCLCCGLVVGKWEHD